MSQVALKAAAPPADIPGRCRLARPSLRTGKPVTVPARFLRTTRRLLVALVATAFVVVPTGTAWAWSDPTPQPLNAQLIGGNVTAGADGTWVPTQAQAVRLWNDGTRWSSLEPSRGTYSWGWLDYLVQHNRAAGKSVLLTLGETPRWASANPNDTSCMFYASSHPTTAGYEPGQCQAPTSETYWTEYVRAVATRYRGQIGAYELWNEANLAGYWKGGATTLAKMTADAASIIHQVDPAATVVSPSVIYVQSTATLDFVSQLIAAGGFRGVNAAAVHLYYYQGPSAPELNVAGVQQLQARLAAAGLAMPVWNTENAWGTATSGPATAYTQQAVMVRNWLVANYLHIPRSYYYTPMPYLPWETAGSPAQLAVQQLKRWYAGATLQGCAHGSEGGLPFDIWQCTFSYGHSGSGYAYGQVRWSTAGNYTEAAPADTTTVENVGSAATPAAAGTQVTISQRPVMVRFVSSVPPGGTVTTPVPTFVGPPAASLLPAPVTISLTAVPTVTSSSWVVASAVVRRSDINSVVPYANVRLCTWTMTNNCYLMTADASGRVSFGFRQTYSTSVTVDSADPGIAFTTVKVRTLALSLLHLTGGHQSLTYSVYPSAGQRYWILRWNGSQFVTVTTAIVPDTAAHTMPVPAGTYQVVTGASSWVTGTTGPTVTVT